MKKIQNNWNFALEKWKKLGGGWGGGGVDGWLATTLRPKREEMEAKINVFFYFLFSYFVLLSY